MKYNIEFIFFFYKKYLGKRGFREIRETTDTLH